MNLLTKSLAAPVVVAVLLAASSAQAAMLTGTDFDVSYDPTTLGQFGTLSLVGDVLFFTPNNFKASSTNGQGVVPDDSTASGIELIANPGFQFGALSVSEFGDYLLSGDGSTVSVSGQLRAFDLSPTGNPITTQTTSTLTPLPSLPLTINTGTSQNWEATASITQSTPTVSNGPAWLNSASAVGITLENLLTAYTAPGGSGSEQAFIEKKFDGVSIDVTPVPLPLAAPLLLCGLAAFGSLGLRRSGLQQPQRPVRR